MQKTGTVTIPAAPECWWGLGSGELPIQAKSLEQCPAHRQCCVTALTVCAQLSARPRGSRHPSMIAWVSHHIRLLSLSRPPSPSPPSTGTLHSAWHAASSRTFPGHSRAPHITLATRWQQNPTKCTQLGKEETQSLQSSGFQR